MGEKPYLSQACDLEHVQASAKEQVAELDGLLLERRRGGLVLNCRHVWNGDAERGPDQGM